MPIGGTLGTGSVAASQLAILTEKKYRRAVLSTYYPNLILSKYTITQFILKFFLRKYYLVQS